ncbi:MAG: cobalamin-binding protein [Porticoccaceae bacterium]|jgi:iron complex transport system substrate-binding protein|nr:cobalamin-binding protein [Porticoccaceae bacterium]
MRLLSILLVCCSLSVMAEVRVVDDNGDEVRLAVPAQRIISLAPNITEVLFHIGAGDQIVGADEYSNYPEAAKQILRVNNHAAANYELILSLKPDLVIAWQSGNGDKIINPLRKLGIPVFVVETHQIERIPNLFRRFGQLSGNNDLAQQRIEEFTQRLQLLGDAQTGKSVVRTFYQIWDQPLITLNGKHMVSDVIELCGGINIFADAVPLVPYVNIESIVAADPQVIIAGGSQEEQPGWFSSWQQWTGISAVQHKQIYLIPADLMQRHSVRILDGAQMMCDYLDSARTAIN